MQKSSDAFDFEVQWLPYLLRSDAPVSGVDKATYYRSRFGPAYDGMRSNLKKVGEAVGINFADDGIIGNTINSHRLIAYAERHGKQDQVVEELFKTYFEKGNNLADVEVLIKAAKAAGLDEEQTRTYLATDEDRDFVLRHANDFASKPGFTGVPHFIFNDRYCISGAQDVTVFENVFKKLQNSNL